MGTKDGLPSYGDDKNEGLLRMGTKESYPSCKPKPSKESPVERRPYPEDKSNGMCSGCGAFLDNEGFCHFCNPNGWLR